MYPMDQAVRTSDSPTFDELTLSGDLLNGYNVTEALKYPEQPASYIIWVDNSTGTPYYYAKNCTTGHVDFAGVNASDVIQSTVNSLSRGGKICFSEGLFEISKTIIIKNPSIILQGSTPWNGNNVSTGMVTGFKLADNSNCNIISIEARKITIMDLCLDGNRNHQTSGHGIYVYNDGAADSRLIRVYILYTKDKGVLWEGGNGVAYDVYVEYTGGIGWRVTGGQNVFIGCSAWATDGFGFENSGAKNTFIGCRSSATKRGFVEENQFNVYIGCQAWNSDEYGFWVSSADYDVFTGCLVYKVPSGWHGFLLDSSVTNTIISDTLVWDDGDGNLGIAEGAVGMSNNLITDCVVDGFSTAVQVSSAKVRNVVGFETEALGVATIQNGSTSVSMAHGLVRAPDYVVLGPTHAEVADAVWSANSTHITITVPNPVSADRDVSWYAVYEP
ncbi:MAG: hypothetical protein ACTSSA_11855 [Candidatus Freyarchaeota archaeon]